MRDKLQERLCYTVLQSLMANVQRQYKTRKKIVLTLQLPSDQHPVSPNKISVQSIDKVTRTIKMINMGKLL